MGTVRVGYTGLSQHFGVLQGLGPRDCCGEVLQGVGPLDCY